MPASCEKIQTAPAAGGQILAMQMARLGDFLQSTRLLASLRDKHPGAKVCAMVTPAQAPLARRCVSVDKVVLVKPAEMQAIAGADMDRQDKRRLVQGLTDRLAVLRPSHIYNLNMSVINTTIAEAWPLARIHGWRMAADGSGLYGKQWFGFMMKMVADRRLTRTHLTDLLACMSDAPAPGFDRLQYRVGPRSAARAEALLPQGHSPLVALQLGTNCDLRRWPIASFAALADGLLKAGFTPVLVGAPSEKHLGARLLENCGAGRDKVLDLMGKTDLPALAALLARCALVVSGDTGTLHLATAAGAKTLSLFMGPAQVHETGPYGNGHLVIQARDKCGPCQEQTPQCKGDAPCRMLITPQIALKATLALLSGAPAAQAAQGLDEPQGVILLEGMIDNYGQRYKVLTPRPLDRIETMALALREAGRMLTMADYRPDMAAVEAEINDEYLPPDKAEDPWREAMAKSADELAGAAQNNDPAVAGTITRHAPGLTPLAMAKGYAPPRLAEACRAAARIMRLVAGFGS